MKMDWLRKSILGGILVIVFILFIRWNEFQEQHQANTDVKSPATQEQNSAPKTASDEFQIAAEAAKPVAVEQKTSVGTAKITVKTNSLELEIDTLGGTISKIGLPKYFAQLNTPDKPYILLENSTARTYIVRSGLIGPNGTEGTASGSPQFTAAASQYVMTDDQNELKVDLTYRQENAEIIKRFVFTRNSHLIGVEYIIKNFAEQPWQASLVGIITRDSYDPTPSQMFAMKPFLGAAATTDDTNYKKFSFDDIAEKPITYAKTGGWVALVQHYFLTAWIPPQNGKNTFLLQKLKDQDLYMLSFTSEPVTVPGQSEKLISAAFYAGPKDIRTLEAIAPHLDLTMDYSFLWWISKPLFLVLTYIHDVVGNWGIAIILLTLFVKILFFYPSAMSYRSMAKMRKVQPKMAALKERYGDDKQKMSQALMKLYKDEKVNPVSGCLPMIIQMPVFLALYWVLMEAVELRHAPFYLWIHDLSVKDPYFVLPLIMGATMYIQQKLNPTPPDPMQAKMMQMMPLIFTFLFVFFPAGLVLYWVVNNSLSIAQQYVITKQIENAK